MFITTLSAQGLETLKQLEGCVLRAYKCSANIWTIGYGHTSAAGAPTVTSNLLIDQSEADKIFRQDLEKFEKRVANHFHTKAQHEFDAAVMFDYNTGTIDSASWVQMFLDDDRHRARDSFSLWTLAGGERIQGLVNRRALEASILFDNQYPEGQLAFETMISPTSVTREDIVKAQRILTTRGFNPGAIDGIIGTKTKSAILAYQERHPKLTNDGVLGIATISQLTRDIELVDNTVKAVAKKGGPISIISGLGSFLLGLPWKWILPAVIVGIVAYYLYNNADIIQARFNKLFKRKVK